MNMEFLSIFTTESSRFQLNYSDFVQFSTLQNLHEQVPSRKPARCTKKEFFI